MDRKCVNDENLCEICRDNVNCGKYTCNYLKLMCNLLVTALIIALFLIVSGIVELNPGPMKKCLKCEKMMPTRFNNYRCGHLLCFVLLRGFYTLVHSSISCKLLPATCKLFQIKFWQSIAQKLSICMYEGMSINQKYECTITIFFSNYNKPYIFCVKHTLM